MTRSGRTVLFVSHDVSSVARLCERAIVLNEGRLVYHGPIEDAIDRYLSSGTLGGGAAADEERQGTGELRIARVEVVRPGGAPGIQADSPLLIRVRLSSPAGQRVEGLRLRLGIHSALGGQYVGLSTDYHPSPLLDSIDLGRGVTVVCALEELPLKPGSYYVSAELARPGGELVDRVTKQAPFGVLPTDYFGTGLIPGEHYVGPVLVRHRWDVEEDALAAVTAQGWKADT
jgi:lipopolysaccharide transport system ATP-binding protein